VKKKMEGNEQQRKQSGQSLGSSKQNGQTSRGSQKTQKAPHPKPGKERE
jgi:hypothetical protein